MQDILQQAEQLLTVHLRNVNVTLQDGTKQNIRIARAYDGAVMYMSRRKRRRGHYLSELPIVSIRAIQPRKSTEQKWIDGWKKVVVKLRESGLWSQIIPDIELALSLGYKTMIEASDLYWNTPNDKQIEVFSERFPKLLYQNDKGEPCLNYSLIWSYCKLPIVKKMRFRKWGNEDYLKRIQQAMTEKKTCKEWGRYGYDISFEYHPEREAAFYSEEYRNCGNGHYYIALNATHALFREND